MSTGKVALLSASERCVGMKRLGALALARASSSAAAALDGGALFLGVGRRVDRSRRCRRLAIRRRTTRRRLTLRFRTTRRRGCRCRPVLRKFRRRRTLARPGGRRLRRPRLRRRSLRRRSRRLSHLRNAHTSHHQPARRQNNRAPRRPGSALSGPTATSTPRTSDRGAVLRDRREQDVRAGASRDGFTAFAQDRASIRRSRRGAAFVQARASRRRLFGISRHPKPHRLIAAIGTVAIRQPQLGDVRRAPVRAAHHVQTPALRPHRIGVRLLAQIQV